MRLPKVFAIYRQSTETFQLLQAEYDEDDNIIRLKQWAQPSVQDIKSMTKETHEQYKCWLNGNEWYVEINNQSTNELKVHDVEIHNQNYKWYHTGYKLVWSNYHIHSRRNSLGAHTWNSSPSIPILDFSSRSIYPRTYSSFYPRWVSVKSSDLSEVLQKSRDSILKMEENVTYSDLRIRTPLADIIDNDKFHDDDDTSDDEEYYDTIEDQCFPIVVASILVSSIVGLYGLIGHMAVCL